MSGGWGWGGPVLAPSSGEANRALLGLSTEVFCLPVQLQSSRPTTAEQRLAVAVIRRAVLDLQLPQSRLNAHIMRAAREWIASEDDGVFSFASLCDHLVLDVGALRRAILAMSPDVRPRHNGVDWDEDE